MLLLYKDTQQPFTHWRWTMSQAMTVHQNTTIYWDQDYFLNFQTVILQYIRLTIFNHNCNIFRTFCATVYCKGPLGMISLFWIANFIIIIVIVKLPIKVNYEIHICSQYWFYDIIYLLRRNACGGEAHAAC